jgi:hypothetical protein
MAMLLSGPPGVAATGGRPAVTDVVAYCPCLIPRDLCTAQVEVIGGGDAVAAEVRFEGPTDGTPLGALPAPDFGEVELTGELVTAPLRDLAHGRSGDKGDTCNVGVIARHPAIYPALRDILTEKRVKEAFNGVAFGDVERFEVPNIWALNFLLHEALGGGGTLSLHIDAQGKTYSHALLSVDVEIDRAYLDLVSA